MKGTVFLSVNDHDKPAIAALALQFVELGFKLVATHGTADVLERAGFVVERVFKVKEGRPNVVDLIKGDRIQLIINTPRGQDTFFDEKAIRRAAVTQRIPTITTIGRRTRRSRAELLLCSNRKSPYTRFKPSTRPRLRRASNGKFSADPCADNIELLKLFNCMVDNRQLSIYYSTIWLTQMQHALTPSFTRSQTQQEEQFCRMYPSVKRLLAK